MAGVQFFLFTDISSQVTMWAGAVAGVVAPIFVEGALTEITRKETDTARSAVADKAETATPECGFRLRGNTKGKRMRTATQRMKKQKKLPCAALTVICATGIAMFGFFLYVRADRPLWECDSLGRDIIRFAVIQEGPMKGIKTSRQVKECYEAAIVDLNLLKSKTSAPMYIANNCRWYYVYLAPYSTGSTWYNQQNNPRQLRWWELHPDKLPEYVYLPYYDLDYYCRDEEKIINEVVL